MFVSLPLIGSLRVDHKESRLRMENRMSPNKSGAAPQDGVSNEGKHSGSASASLLNNIVVNGEEGGYRTDKSDVVDDPMLTTDCPSYGAVINNIPKIFPPRKEEHDGSDASTPSQKITIESIKGNSDDEFEDDRSSVVTESSLSNDDDDDHVEGDFHEGLKRSANTLAVDAINCASDELQGNGSNVICVQSELRPGRSSDRTPALPANVGVNNGYVMSEVGKPSRSRDMKRNGKALVLSEPEGGIVPSTATTVSPLGQQTTAIFNESTDITLGNKTFITGSLTIKQYIKDNSSGEYEETEKREKRNVTVHVLGERVYSLLSP